MFENAAKALPVHFVMFAVVVAPVVLVMAVMRLTSWAVHRPGRYQSSAVSVAPLSHSLCLQLVSVLFRGVLFRLLEFCLQVYK